MKMSLENLLKTGQMQPHNPTREAVQRLLRAAARNIADARVDKISGENRFDAAYKSIMQCAMAALWANRYRTSTSQPGPHKPLKLKHESHGEVLLPLKPSGNLSQLAIKQIATAMGLSPDELIRLAK